MAKRKKLHGICTMNGIKFMEMYEDGSEKKLYVSEEQCTEWGKEIGNKKMKPYIENNPDVAHALIECGVLKPVIPKNQRDVTAV